MIILNGKEIAEKILNDLKVEMATLRFQPVFVDVLVGDDPVARSYVNTKARAATKIGINFQMVEVPANVSNEDLVAKLKEIQENRHLAGLIIQLPLPEHLDKMKILNSIKPQVDVDCLTQTNSELFYQGKSPLIPPTAAAVMTVLEVLNINLSQAQILVIGQGELVGKPVTFLLRQAGLDVVTADESTLNLQELSVTADVIISAAGRAHLVTGEMIKAGATIIDCGTAESKGGIAGDVDMLSVEPKAGAISPVPGGVGPVTVAKLLSNVVAVAKNIKPNV